MLTDLTVKDFLDRLASDAPTPGGGSAAALAGAVAASLAGMVVALTLRSEKHQASHEALRPLTGRLGELRRELTRLVDADSASYDAVVAANRLPRETPDQKTARAAARATAFRLATETPLATAEASCEVVVAAEAALAAGINMNAASDLGAALLLCRAAIGGAALNVEINLPSLKDETFVTQVRDRLRIATQEGARRADAASAEIQRRMS
jgi:formiminotetrahydrofolate cyclodeaminase